MDGLEAIRTIRQHEHKSGRHTPIVALTALVMPGDQQRCLSAGADDYMPKPVSPDALLTTAGRWLPGCLDQAEGQLHPRQVPAALPASAPGIDRSDSPGEFQQCCRSIEQALQCRDFARVEESAGRLKRLSLSHGVRPLADQAMRVQFAARGSDAEHLVGAVERLRSVCTEASSPTTKPAVTAP